MPDALTPNPARIAVLKLGNEQRLTLTPKGQVRRRFDDGTFTSSSTIGAQVLELLTAGWLEATDGPIDPREGLLLRPSEFGEERLAAAAAGGLGEVCRLATE